MPIEPFNAGSTGSIRAHISSLSTSVRVIDAASRLKDAQLRRHALEATAADGT